MKVIEAFKVNKLPNDVLMQIKDLELVKVQMVNGKNIVNIFAKNESIIHPYFIEQYEMYITNAYFLASRGQAKLLCSYSSYEDLSSEEIYNQNKDYIIYAVTSFEHKYQYLFDNCNLSFENDKVTFDFANDFICNKSSDGLVNKFIEIFSLWFNRELSSAITFHNVEHEDYTTAEYEYFEPALYKKAPVQAEMIDLKQVKEKKQVQSTPKVKKPGEFTIKKKLPEDPDIIYGRNFEGDFFKINELADGLENVVIRGMITSVDIKEIRNERIILFFNITDFTDTICSKIFTKKDECAELTKTIKVGNFVKMMASCRFDTFDKSLGMTNITGIKKCDDFRIKRKDNSEVKRVELHAHTQMSDMDAVTNVSEYIKTAFKWGHKAAAITDHGVVQAFTEASHALNPKKYEDPEEQKRCKAFKIIYGCEGYLVEDSDLIDEFGNPKMSEKDYIEAVRQKAAISKANKNKVRYYHIILLAKNDLGRANLYKLVSDSHLKYYNHRPLIPKSVLKKNKEGIIIGSACEAGELFRAIVNKESDEVIEEIASLYDYYEVQPTGNNYFMVRDDIRYPEITSERDLENLNKKVIELADKHGKPCVATCDSHFLNPEDEIYRRIIMAGKGFDDADKQPPLFFRTTEEMLGEFSYLPKEKAYEIVVTNTNKIADMIEQIAPVRPDKCPPVIENSDNDLRDMCYKKAQSWYGDPLPEIVKTRLDKELNSIISNGYSVMYIIAQKLVKKSNDDGYLVGSRGSVGSSFVATMSSITEVNPLPPHYYCPNCFYSDFDSADVKFAIENSLSGFDLPDKVCPKCGKRLVRDGQNIPFETFLGFYGDKEPDIDLNFSGEYQGKAHAYTEVIFGEGHTFKAGTIGTLAEKTAFGFIKKYYEERGLDKRTAEIERIVQGCVGVRRTTGQHPGGIVVLPHGEEIYTFTPVQHPANDMESDIITTHFDYHSIDHNLLKLDILGHDDPTMIRFLEDLTGEDAKTWPMDDKKVISLFNSTEALGVEPKDIDCDLGSLGLPELGTNFVMNMLKETKPESFSDMIRISGLSHGTDVWTNNAQELVKEGKCTLSTAICTRDDIMTFLILKGVEAGKAFKIMESVRKGKGLTPEMEETMVANNIPDWYIWSCKKIKYMFPKAHACAYIMMAFRIAYCKVYHPLAYYAAYFSIRATDFDYEMMARGQKHLLDVMEELKTKINNKTNTPKENDLYEDAKLVREMYARGYEFMPIDIYKAKADRFQIIDGKLMPSLSTINGMGGKAAELVEEISKTTVFQSRNEFKNLCKVPQTVVDSMNEMGLFGDLPEDIQLSLFDLFNIN